MSLAITALAFVTILLLLFALFLFLAGIFTAYFGSGKSRAIGVVLLVVGLAVGILSGYYYHLATGIFGAFLYQTFLVLVAAVLGALAAVGVFLVAIMKS
jgi:hypothetical protein